MSDLVVCQRCHEPIPTEQLLEHLRLLHPDVDAEPGDTVAADLTDPTEAYEAAARAYCLNQYTYDPVAYVSDRARRDHIAVDTSSTAEEPWLRAAVDAVFPIMEAATRAKVAAEIRQKSFTWCMDGTGRHLVENCAKIAEGSIDGR
jgi:hypothetical protein